MAKMFRLQNYNEFKDSVRWHDYFSIMVNEFPVLVRKYDLRIQMTSLLLWFRSWVLKFISELESTEMNRTVLKKLGNWLVPFKNVLTKCPLIRSSRRKTASS
jgi:hypothetical protein